MKLKEIIIIEIEGQVLRVSKEAAEHLYKDLGELFGEKYKEPFIHPDIKEMLGRDKPQRDKNGDVVLEDLVRNPKPNFGDIRYD